ncbi:MAG: bis(5'-nucleosyl)-tetraphosphatase [Planctomycetota bacterium]
MEDGTPSPPAVGSAANPVLAAGVILWSGSLEEPRFLLLQNDRHGTWSFAKGHLEDGEDLLTGALREVEEETGIQLTSDGFAPHFADTSIYQVEGRYKRVVYFLHQAAVEESALQTSKEHRDAVWLEEAEAVARLEYSDLKRTLIRASEWLLRMEAA